MLNTTYLAFKITGYLSTRLSLDKDRTDIVQYALDVLLSTSVNLLLTLYIAHLLGVFRYAFIILLTSAALRFVSGGSHCSSSGRCIVASIITTPLFGLAARKFAIHSFTTSPLSIWVIFSLTVIFSLISLYLWAPADTPNKPITSKLARDTLRRNSFICAVIIDLIIFHFLVRSSQLFHLAEVYAALIGLIWQSFSLSPAGYRIIHQLDRFLQLLGIN